MTQYRRKKSTTKKLSGPVCPICGEEVFLGYEGTPGTPVLVVTDTPEVGKDKPLSFAMDVLRSEMARESLDLYSFTYMPLYRHVKLFTDTSSIKSKPCFSEHAKWLFEEIAKYEIIFAAGPEVVKMLTRLSNQDCSGLRMESDLISADKILICSISPSVAYERVVGELRLAVQKLASEYKHYNELWGDF